MIRNGKDIENGTELHADVCIVGSGPAGVTAAWHLQKAGKNVILIEGSRPAGSLQQSWPDKLLLYNGVADGLFATNEPEFLTLPFAGQQSGASERERVFGGTSLHWGGQCRPLDPITFETRDGFPGWPITRQDLDPYYAKAAAFCSLAGDDFSAEYWARVLKAKVPDLPGFDTEMYQFRAVNFATQKFEGGQTIGESAADVILNASLLEIDHGGGAVKSLRVASMNDQTPPQKRTEFTIRAKAYVLACGAVANARQLLLSKAGNEHDQVGRYFSCHPIPDWGYEVVTVTKNFLKPDEQRLMDGQGLSGVRPIPWQSANGVRVQGRFSPNAEQQRKLGIGSCWFVGKSTGYYFEMAPNPDSRITLADTRDPVFAQPQTSIKWLLSDRDQQTYAKTTQLFQTAVTSLGGEVSFVAWEDLVKQLMVNGHHIGTTRMSAKPEDGVVDGNLKVHSLDNLYVAGSSVFASAGISNPTFSIITLSIRLADHLLGRA